jgi:hypothetical protein
MKNTNSDIFKKLSFLRGIIPAENLATALFIALKVKKEANKPDDINEALYDCSQFIRNKYNCNNVFENKNVFLNFYQTVSSMGLDWIDILNIDTGKFSPMQIPRSVGNLLLDRVCDNISNVLIKDGEKFSLTLKDIVDKNKNCAYLITTTQVLYFEVLKEIFAEYQNVEIMQVGMNDFEFTSQKFDLILSLPPFGVRMMVERQRDFICREYELASTESLLYHLSFTGKLVTILPARITFATGRVEELRNFIQKMYKIEEISELPTGIFSSTAIKTYLFTIASGMTDDVTIRRYKKVVDKKSKEVSIKLEDETFVMSTELEDFGDWNIDKIFARQDDDWQNFQNSNTKRVTLSDIATSFRGKVVNSKDETGAIGVVNIANIKEFDIDYNSLYHLDTDERKISNYILEDGDILIPARGTTIKTAVFKVQQYPCIASSNLIVIRVNQNQILPVYLKIFLDSPLGVKQIKGLQQGTTLMNISYKDIMSVEIPMIPLEEQKVISEEYEKELSLYQNTISAANDRWQNVVKELQNKF